MIWAASANRRTSWPISPSRMRSELAERISCSSKWMLYVEVRRNRRVDVTETPITKPDEEHTGSSPVRLEFPNFSAESRIEAPLPDRPQ